MNTIKSESREPPLLSKQITNKTVFETQNVDALIMHVFLRIASVKLQKVEKYRQNDTGHQIAIHPREHQ